MFYLDLDEIDSIARSSRWLSRNRANLFAFRDRDHLQKPGKDVKDSLLSYLKDQGMVEEPGRILLLTHLNTWGYTFNPVSFYYVFSISGKPLCAVAEINNTFGEMKPFFLGSECFDGNTFRSRQTKYFYISPFMDMDTELDFNLALPGNRLQIQINDYQENRKFFLSTLVGKRVPLTDRMLFFYFLRFPAITISILLSIHWQAMKLWLRGLPYHKKTDQLELQREVYHGRSA